MKRAAIQSLRPARGRRNILAAAASGIHQQIVRDGGDPDAVLAGAGLAAIHVEDPKRALDLGAYVDLIEQAATHTGNDNFGLVYGQGFTPERLGLIGDIALASPTLGETLRNLAELFPYHQQASEVRVLAEDGHLRLEYRILDGDIVDRRQDAELTLGMFANIMRHCLGADWAPIEVHCEHPRPEMWRMHERYFDAPFHFCQRTNALLIKRGDLAARMPDADPRRLAALREELLRIAGDTGSIGLMGRVLSEVRSRLPEGGGSVEEVARSIGMPRWTLQRRLDREGCTYSSLIDRVRGDLAGRYLRQRSLSSTDIAFMLGYSELSAFSRAFKRWHGISPQRYREAIGLA